MLEFSFDKLRQIQTKYGTNYVNKVLVSRKTIGGFDADQKAGHKPHSVSGERSEAERLLFCNTTRCNTLKTLTILF